MDSGRFDTQVLLQRQVVTRSATGGQSITHQTAGTLWARIEPLTGAEAIAVRGQVAAKSAARITLPWSPVCDQIVETWRVLAGTRAYDIVSIAWPGKQADEVELLAETGVKG